MTKMLDLESFRKEIDQIYIEKMDKMVNSLDPEIVRKHQERMDAQWRLKNKKPTKTTIAQGIMVQESKYKQESISRYMRTKQIDTHQQSKRFQIDSLKHAIYNSQMTVNEGNDVLVKENIREKKALVQNVKGQKDKFRKDVDKMIKTIHSQNNLMDKQFYESESIRVKSLEHLNHYEFDEDETPSNEEKVLNRKEKKQLEDQKFDMYVKYHDILKYGKSSNKIKENENSQSRERRGLYKQDTFSQVNQEFIKDQQKARANFRQIKFADQDSKSQSSRETLEIQNQQQSVASKSSVNLMVTNPKSSVSHSIKMFEMKKRLSKRADLGPYSESNLRKKMKNTQMMKNFPVKTLNFYIQNTLSQGKIPIRNLPIGSTSLKKSSILTSPKRSTMTIKRNFNSQSTLDRSNKLTNNRLPIGGIQDVLNFPLGSIIKAPIQLKVSTPVTPALDVLIQNKFYATEVQTHNGTPEQVQENTLACLTNQKTIQDQNRFYSMKNNEFVRNYLNNKIMHDKNMKQGMEQIIGKFDESYTTNNSLFKKQEMSRCQTADILSKRKVSRTETYLSRNGSSGLNSVAVLLNKTLGNTQRSDFFLNKNSFNAYNFKQSQSIKSLKKPKIKRNLRRNIKTLQDQETQTISSTFDDHNTIQTK